MQKFQIEKKNSHVTAQNEKLNLHKSTANGKTHFPKISLALAKWSFDRKSWNAVNQSEFILGFSKG